MSAIISAIVSIVVIAALVRLAGGQRREKFSVCPVCAGVVGTWLWMLAARFASVATDPIILAMLMGASVVGLAHQLEPRLPPESSRPLFNMLVLVIGFADVYSVVSEHWTATAFATLLLISAIAWFMRPWRAIQRDEEAVKDIEQKMKNCC